MDQLPKASRVEFRAFIIKGCLVAKNLLQSVLDIVDSSARVMAFAGTTKGASWLQNSGIAPNVQQAIQDLPFNSLFPFSDKVNETLHCFKDCRAILRSLGVHMLAVQRCHYSGQQQQQYHPQCTFWAASLSHETVGLPQKEA